jgi:DedD protein
MGLLSLFQRQPRQDDAPHEPSPAEPDAVAAARTRARRRLIGAAVLLGIGVVGFPLLFETQPRPIGVDIPIEIPRKDGAPPLVLPAPAAPSVALSPASAALLPAEPTAAEPDRSAPRGVTKPAPAEIVERAEDAGREPAAKVVAASPPPRASTPVAAAVASAAVTPKPQAAASKPAPARTPEDGARAQALLNGQASSAAAVRVVVQVGAYSDADKLREARQKLEKLGLKTYTQVIEVDGAKRTRVRVGPFETRADADKAAARIRAAGLPVAILSL